MTALEYSELPPHKRAEVSMSEKLKMLSAEVTPEELAEEKRLQAERDNTKF